ncbi:acyl-CoA dehydrogenase family protein [uncultured Alsobacter sp.]|uniref:acyl-CoA dehydrogenase family protein n=1 Tax=uncultured Alsobacter sp. TaxID=1748258 RepID=UPI0025ED7D77|nr:acyl-CoA dehydrogenase family protein [uncultured Alsobacter sp.]
MSLVLSEDQVMIRDEAARLFAEMADSARIREVLSHDLGHDAQLWARVAGDLGWCSLTVPEQSRGLGLGAVETVILMEAAGRRLAPVPLWSTAAFAVALLAHVSTPEACETWLPRIAAGETIAAVAAPGISDASGLMGIAAETENEGYRLSGRVGPLIDAPVADLLLVIARMGTGRALFALRPGQGVEVRRVRSLDGTRSYGELDLSHVPAMARIDRGDLSEDDWTKVVATAQLALAAEEVGAARGAMDVTLAYIADRVQFGRTIASFQAIKHRCARLEIDLAEARAMVYGAAANAVSASPQERLLEALGARALATDLAFRAAEEAIQLHGGVGFTWEYDPHLYFKRAQASAMLLGRQDEHLSTIADIVLRAGVGS